jgi:hypothetical protein
VKESIGEVYGSKQLDSIAPISLDLSLVDKPEFAHCINGFISKFVLPLIRQAYLRQKQFLWPLVLK